MLHSGSDLKMRTCAELLKSPCTEWRLTASVSTLSNTHPHRTAAAATQGLAIKRQYEYEELSMNCQGTIRQVCTIIIKNYGHGNMATLRLTLAGSGHTGVVVPLTPSVAAVIQTTG